MLDVSEFELWISRLKPHYPVALLSGGGEAGRRLRAWLHEHLCEAKYSAHTLEWFPGLPGDPLTRTWDRFRQAILPRAYFVLITRETDSLTNVAYELGTIVEQSLSGRPVGLVFCLEDEARGSRLTKGYIAELHRRSGVSTILYADDEQLANRVSRAIDDRILSMLLGRGRNPP
jgi:hypothetical protein